MMSKYAGDSVADDDTDLLNKQTVAALGDFLFCGIDDVAAATPGGTFYSFMYLKLLFRQRSTCQLPFLHAILIFSQI